MKNFFKKLSFVMAAAMVVTSLHVPAEAKAASKDYVYVKGSKKAITSKSLFVGGQSVNFDYVVGSLKNKGANGKWSVKDTSIATVNKDGVVTAVGVGETTLVFTAKKSKKVKKAVKKTVKLTTLARAESVTVSPASLSVVVGKSEEADVMLNVSEALAAKGVKSTYMTFAEIDNASAAAVKVENGKLMVEAKEMTASPATITVYAAQKNTLEAVKANKFMKKAEVKLEVKAEFSVEQKGANKITVMGNNLATNPALYVLKNDRGVKLDFKKDELKPENNMVTLVSEVPIITPGKYTLTFNEKEKAEFEMVTAKVKEIKFLNAKKAVLDIKDRDKRTVLVRYQVFDQFGDDVTNTGIPDLNVTTSATSSSDFNRGIIKIQNQEAFNQNIDTVFVSIVDKKEGIQIADNFEVTSKVLVDSLTFAGIYDIKNLKKVEKITENNKDDIKNYALMFEVKDQYGSVFEAQDNDATAKAIMEPNRQYGVNLVGVTGIKTTNKVLVRDIAGKKYVLEMLDIGSELRAGKVDITTVCYNNGKIQKDSFEVNYRVKVDDLRLSEGPKGIYNDQENELSYVATDIDGKPITKYDDLKPFFADPKNLTSVSGSFGLKKNDKTGEGIITFTPNAYITGETASTQVNVNIITETLKPRNQQLTVYAIRFPKKFNGVKDTAKLGTTRVKDAFVEIKLSDLIFKDQYGNDISANEIAKSFSGQYAMKVKTTDDVEAAVQPGFTYAGGDDFNSANGKKVEFLHDGTLLKLKVKANSTGDNVDEGSRTVVPLTLSFTDYAGTNVINEKALNIYNVPLKELKDFAIDSEDLKNPQPAADLYTNKSSSATKYLRTHTFKPHVYGVYDGVRIKLADSQYVVFDGVTGTAAEMNNVNTEQAHAGEMFVKVPDMDKIAKGQTEGTAKLVLIVKEVAKRLEAEYKYSKVGRKVSKVTPDVYDATNNAGGKFDAPANGVYALKEVIGGNKVVWNSSDGADIKLNPAFGLKDQYGKSFTSADEKPFVTFSTDKANEEKVEYSKNGATDASFKLAGAHTEATVTVTLRFPGADKTFSFKISVKKA